MPFRLRKCKQTLSRHIKEVFFFKGFGHVPCGILSFKTVRSHLTTAQRLACSLRFPEFMSSGEYAKGSAIGWNQVQTQRLHALYGHVSSAFSFRFFMQMYSNDQLYAVVVRACAVRERNTAKIQSFCSVSAVLCLFH